MLQTKDRHVMSVMLILGWGTLFLFEQALKRCPGMDIWNIPAQAPSIVSKSKLLRVITIVMRLQYYVLMLEDWIFSYEYFYKENAINLISWWLNQLTRGLCDELTTKKSSKKWFPFLGRGCSLTINTNICHYVNAPQRSPAHLWS